MARAKLQIREIGPRTSDTIILSTVGIYYYRRKREFSVLKIFFVF